MPRASKTPEQRIAELAQKKAQLEARIQKEQAKIKGTERKNDTRRKIIAGALALEHAEKDSEFSVVLNRLISRHVERPDDRALFGLAPKEKTPGQDLQKVEN